jgi:hypothetical protein
VITHCYISKSTLVTRSIVAGKERTNHIRSDTFTIETASTRSADNGTISDPETCKEERGENTTTKNIARTRRRRRLIQAASSRNLASSLRCKMSLYSRAAAPGGQPAPHKRTDLAAAARAREQPRDLTTQEPRRCPRSEPGQAPTGPRGRLDSVRSVPERPPRGRPRRWLHLGRRRPGGPCLHGLPPPPPPAGAPARAGGGGEGGVGEGLREVEDAELLHPLHVLPDPRGPHALVVRSRRLERGHRAARGLRPRRRVARGGDAGDHGRGVARRGFLRRRRRRRRRDFSEEGEGTGPNRRGEGGAQSQRSDWWPPGRGRGFYGRGRRRLLRPSPSSARPVPSLAAGAWDRAATGRGRARSSVGESRQRGRFGGGYGASGRARTVRVGVGA